MDKEKDINPQMLLLARELNGLIIVDLAEKLGISRSYVNKLESHGQVISTDLLESLSKVLGLPASFFYQEGEMIPSYLSYRRREKVPSKDINRIEANINLYRLGIQKLLKSSSHPNTNLPHFVTDKTKTPQECAKALRKMWKIPKGVIVNMSNILEEQNVIHVCFDFGTDRVDGKSVLIEQNQPLIFTNSRLFGDRERFTLAYQLGHLVMHSNIENTFGKDISHEANLFAAEFLMPEKDIAKDLENGLTIDTLAMLKKKWKCSMISLVYRANDLELITENQKRYLEKQFNQMKIRKREPVELDIPREQPKLLRDIITKYKQRQKLSLKQLAEFFNLNENDFLDRYNLR